MSYSNFPSNYLDFNSIDTKNLNIVVEIEGSDYLFALVPTYKKIRYGDPDIHYGDAGLVYGGLKEIGNVKPILSVNSNLIISQKIEPEQGRASAATMTLEFVDLDGFMTSFVSPGVQLNEILGGKLVKVWIGYTQTSFKEDYFVMFRGYVSSTTAVATKLIMQITDPNIKRKSQVFFTGKTQLIGEFKNFNPSDVNTTTQFITINGHGFSDNDEVTFTSTGSLPSGLASNINYYIGNSTTNTFQLYNAPESDGTRFIINYASQGSGVHKMTLNRYGTKRTRILLLKPDGFINPIIGPNGFYDSSVSLFIKVDNEYMKYTALSGNLLTVVRSQRSTTADFHNTNSDVSNVFELQGNVIDLALKVMLSGWNGPWISNVKIASFNETMDLTVGVLDNAIVLPDAVDAVEDYGLAPGDYLTVTGSSFNNRVFTVKSFTTANGYANKVIFVNETTIYETLTTPVMSIRSQYDTLPIACGTKLKPIDLDLAGWQKTRQIYCFQADCVFRIFISQPESGKDWIEQQLLLPTGLYSTTRFGRLSCSATKPPLASDLLVVLDNSNVIDPQNTSVTRSINSRRFFNEVQVKYDYTDDDKETNILSLIDTDSLFNFDTQSVLPITAKGLRTDLLATSFIKRRAGYIVRRYKNAAYEISIKTNFKAASLVQVSDTVLLNDNGNLQITNFETGKRDIGSQLFEVIQTQPDLKSGTGQLTLLSNLGYQATDRFGGIAPSSQIDATQSTTTRLKMKPSYGAKYSNQEYKKWTDITGDYVRVHSKNETFSEETQIIGFDSIDPNIMIVSPALSLSPVTNWIIDLARFNEASQDNNRKSKLLYAYIDPTLFVVTGISDTQFTVSSSDALKVVPGYEIKIHNPDYSINSVDVFVDTLVGVTVTLKSSLGFTPSTGQKIELVGFKDISGPYKIL